MAIDQEDREIYKLAKRYMVTCIGCREQLAFFPTATKEQAEADLLEQGWAARGAGRWKDCWLCPTCTEQRSIC